MPKDMSPVKASARVFEGFIVRDRIVSEETERMTWGYSERVVWFEKSVLVEGESVFAVPFSSRQAGNNTKKTSTCNSPTWVPLRQITCTSPIPFLNRL